MRVELSNGFDQISIIRIKLDGICPSEYVFTSTKRKNKLTWSWQFQVKAQGDAYLVLIFTPKLLKPSLTSSSLCVFVAIK